MQPYIDQLTALVDRLRPEEATDIDQAERHFVYEINRLSHDRPEAAALGSALAAVLGLPYQAEVYAELGVRSARGFALELLQRLSERILPPAPDNNQMHNILRRVFWRRTDHLWVCNVADQSWLTLAAVLQPLGAPPDSETENPHDVAMGNVLDAIRLLSYRLAGAGLDRELLTADLALEQHESPFVAQSAGILLLLDGGCLASQGSAESLDDLQHLHVLLQQCDAALERVRRKACERGISVRLSYLLARLNQLTRRLRELLNLASTDDRPPACIQLGKELLFAEQNGQGIRAFIGENLSLLARNITISASRAGEHYIVNNRAEWLQILRSAAGGGVVIAMMAVLKLFIGHLQWPVLAEGLAYSLNYAVGFVAMYLLGFSVATKQPAMTAAAIAATLEDSRPRDLARTADLAQKVIRSQFAAVLGNVALALPLAFLLVAAATQFSGAAISSPVRLHHLLEDMDLRHLSTLLFAAIAGGGLFLTGMVSGYFDNQIRYHGLAARVAHAPWLRWLSADRAARAGNYLDIHGGAILGNLFFGSYLGLVGLLGTATGLPLGIRHVAFSSANLGVALAGLGLRGVLPLLPWALAGLLGIALVNLLVSFGLALYVAMQSRRFGAPQLARLGGLLVSRFVRRPLSFLLPGKG